MTRWAGGCGLPPPNRHFDRSRAQHGAAEKPPPLPPPNRHFDRSRAQHGAAEKPPPRTHKVSPLRAWRRSGRNDGVGGKPPLPPLPSRPDSFRPSMRRPRNRAPLPSGMPGTSPGMTRWAGGCGLPPPNRHFDRSRAEHGGVEKPPPPSVTAGLVPAIHAPAAQPRPLPSRMPGTPPDSFRGPGMTRWAGGCGLPPPNRHFDRSRAEHGGVEKPPPRPPSVTAGLVPAIHAPAALPRPLSSGMPGTPPDSFRGPGITRWGGVGCHPPIVISTGAVRSTAEWRNLPPCHPPIVISTGAVRSTAQRRNLPPARTRFLHSAPGGAPVEMTAWGESRPSPRPPSVTAGLVPAIHAPAAQPRPLPSRMPGTSPGMTRWGGVGRHPPIVISTGAVRSTAEWRNLPPAPLPS